MASDIRFCAPTKLHPINGITLASTCAVKSRTRDDLSVMQLCEGSVVCGVFTQNQFSAAPVLVCREHLAKGGNKRGLIINAGIANAGTLGRGKQDAKKTCQILARQLGCAAHEILPFSTGVISEYLPMQRYADGLARCASQLTKDGWLAAAHAMMTTDTVAKGMSKKVGGKTITGIAKGSGMIHPNMRTMLAFVATDAALPAGELKRWHKTITRDSFNAISVDGDTSTNDSFILIATGKAGAPRNTKEKRALQNGLAEVSNHLAEAIVRDGEGASKLMVINISGGSSHAACRAVADAVARSPLVKTAMAASDANVGRLLMALGNAATKLNPKQVQLKLGNVLTLDKGGLAASYNEAAANKVLQQAEIPIHIRIGSGKHTLTFKTCDLTHRYIEINASYRS